MATGGGRGQGRAMAPRLAAAALLFVCALDVAGAAQGLPSGLTVRQAAAAVAVPWAGGRLPQVLPLRRHGSRQLYLRGAGEDGDEEAEEEGGEDVGEEGGSGQEEEAMDSDAGPMTLVKAIKEVLYYARIHHGVAKGIKEVVQALERGEAQLVVLAEDCDHGDYVALVTALCSDKGVYMMKVPEKAKLGDWAGQHKLDADANVKKTRASSCVAVKDFGEQSEGLAFLLQHIKAEQADAGAGTDGDAGDQEAEADGVPGDEMAGEADEAEEEL